MKKLLCATLIGYGFLTAHAAKDIPSIPDINSTIKVSSMAPDFDTKDTNDKAIKLSDLKGKLVVLEWTNANCPFVRKHYDSKNMQDLQKKYTEKGIVWISIISSAPGREGYKTAAEANEQVKKDGSHATHVILDSDGKIGRTFGAKTTPHMFVLNKDGKIAYMGAIDNQPSALKDSLKEAHNYVAEALDALIAGKEVTVKETDSYGCSVKYAS